MRSLVQFNIDSKFYVIDQYVIYIVVYNIRFFLQIIEEHYFCF